MFDISYYLMMLSTDLKPRNYFKSPIIFSELLEIMHDCEKYIYLQVGLLISLNIGRAGDIQIEQKILVIYTNCTLLES